MNPPQEIKVLTNVLAIMRSMILRNAILTTTIAALFLGATAGHRLHAAEPQPEFRTASIFTDHMVLQRDQPLPVWGWAAPSRAVTVEVGPHSARTRTNAEGRWRLTLPPLESGKGPLTMTVKAGDETIRLTDIPVDDGALGPITGVMESPLVDLMTAAEQTGVANMDSHSFMAVEKAEALQADGQLRGLSVDEAAAIALYTAESEFYRTLNVLLRNRSREALKPFFPYLRLLLQARSKLPKHTQSVWRGVKGVDLTGSFPKGKKIFWWAFNSTSKNVL